MANLQTFERSEYQQVKADLHRKILDRLDLEKLGRTPGDAAREEVLVLIRNTVNSEAVPLTQEGSYDKLLPSFNAGYWFSDELVLRVGAARVMASRPAAL